MLVKRVDHILALQLAIECLLSVVLSERENLLESVIAKLELPDFILAKQRSEDEDLFKPHHRLGVASQVLCLILQVLLVIVDQEEVAHVIVRRQAQVLSPMILRFLLEPPLIRVVALFLLHRSIFEIVEGDVASVSHQDVTLEGLKARVKLHEVVQVLQVEGLPVIDRWHGVLVGYPAPPGLLDLANYVRGLVGVLVLGLFAEVEELEVEVCVISSDVNTELMLVVEG